MNEQSHINKEFAHGSEADFPLSHFVIPSRHQSVKGLTEVERFQQLERRNKFLQQRMI
jgi:hypothetical protein